MEQTKNDTPIRITLRPEDAYDISDHLYGIFLEDIGFSVDGGLNANMVNNYSFDGVYLDKKTLQAKEDPLRYWSFQGAAFSSETEGALSPNSRYADIRTEGQSSLINYGYNGLQNGWEIPAMSICAGQTYTFAACLKNRDFSGQFSVQVLDGEDHPLTDTALLTLPLAQTDEIDEASSDLPAGSGWKRISLALNGVRTGYGKLRILFDGNGTLGLDCVDIHSDDLWHTGDPKWRHGHLRRDLVETLAELHPRFMRFPGGCIVEGLSAGNEYNWKDTVGRLWERKSNYNLWSEKIPDGGYNQSYQIGFYEYFCLCEDLDMLPLPTLSAGMNCQIRAMQYKLKENTMIPIDAPEFQRDVIDSYLDLIAFANGDPKENKWAALRADMGHPKPFGLKYIGVGNENWGKEYLKRYDRITAAIHERYPDIQCIICCGFTPFQILNRSVWKHIKKHHPGAIADEHSYHSPEWFIKASTRYDRYDRKQGKVYMGEYSANGNMAGKKMTVENSNCLDSAIGEAAFMTGLERNGDVVEMASYAPLLNLVGSKQWYANMIDFNPKEVSPTVNYWNQLLFSRYYGPRYLPFSGDLPKGSFLSVTEDTEYIYIKMVNSTDAPVTLSVQGLSLPDGTYKGQSLGGTAMDVQNKLSFTGSPLQNLKPEAWTAAARDNLLTFTVSARCIAALALPKSSR